MPKTQSFMPLVLLLILASNAVVSQLLPASQSRDTVYTLPITLTVGREIKPFDEYLLEATSTRISKVTMGKGSASQLLQSDTVRTALSGICKVAAVTEDGQEAVKTVTIRNAQSRYKGEIADIVPTGAKVTSTFTNAGNLYVINDDTLSAETTADLSGLIRSEGGLKSGVIMDPHKPVSPGDTWSIDTAAFAATLGPPPSTKKRMVQGTVTFTRIDTVNGVPAAVLTMNARADNAFGEIEGMQANSAVIAATIEMVVPMDQRLPAIQVASTTNLDAEVSDSGKSIHFSYHVADELAFRR